MTNASRYVGNVDRTIWLTVGQKSPLSGALLIEAASSH